MCVGGVFCFTSRGNNVANRLTLLHALEMAPLDLHAPFFARIYAACGLFFNMLPAWVVNLRGLERTMRDRFFFLVLKLLSFILKTAAKTNE